MIDQDQSHKTIDKQISEDSSSEHVSARHVHYPSILRSTIEFTFPPAPMANSVLLIPNRVNPTPTSNGYNYLYSSDSDDDPVFKEMVDSKTIKSINKYIVVPPPLKIASTPTKALKKKRKTRGRSRIATIKRAQSDKTASARFLSTALHSVSQAITRTNTNKIAVHNNKDTACFADSGASDDMFPDYSTFNMYHRISNSYATLCDTTRLPI